ncbi:SIR2 family protein [bacterium]|nr:SIR2 family protein [bacterium]
MKKVKIGTCEANSLISELKQSDFVIFTGSTISSWEPTCLFSGRQFTDEMFKFLFPLNFVDNNSKERDILEKLFKKVPFEHLLERYPNRNILTSVFTKIFSLKEYNPLHKVLGQALIEGEIKALITTNYDLCFDEVFKQRNDSRVLRITAKDDIVQDDIKNKKIYFKIHGSDDNPSTLIFTLTHESVLESWKRKILWETLNQRRLLIIGYSGADFEICPEIERMPIKQIVWNTKEDEFPSNNAKILLTQKSGIQLIGDMKTLLIDLFGKEIDSSFNPQTDKIDFVKLSLESNKAKILEWRASLLNSMGVPSLAQKASEELLSTVASGLSMDYIRAIRQKAQALFHLGKYRESASLFHKASLIAKRINNKYLEADLLLDVSTSLRNYKIFCLKNYVKVAERIIMNLKNIDEQKRHRLLGKIFLRKATQWKFFGLIEKRLKLSFFSQWINRRAKEFLQKAANLSLNAGNWFDFYQIRLLSDRMGIPIDISSSDYYEPPPTKDAYTQLGYYIPLSIHFREELKQKKESLTEEDEAKIYGFFKTAKDTKNSPEIWKIALVGIKKSRKWRKNKQVWKDFFQSFFACQYTIGMRIFKLIFGE